MLFYNLYDSLINSFYILSGIDSITLNSLGALQTTFYRPIVEADWKYVF